MGTAHPTKLARCVLQDSIADLPPSLPWQISGETLANMAVPNQTFEYDGAAIAVSDVEQDPIVIRSIFVKPEMRGQGIARQLLETMITSRYIEKVWKVPILCPEEIGGIFEGFGFKKESLSQFQMVLWMS